MSGKLGQPEGGGHDPLRRSAGPLLSKPDPVEKRGVLELRQSLDPVDR